MRYHVRTLYMPQPLDPERWVPSQERVAGFYVVDDDDQPVLGEHGQRQVFDSYHEAAYLAHDLERTSWEAR